MSARNTLTAARHIVVEGPIGAGKTSLARLLGAHIDAQLLLEQPELNPFLARFYEDQQRFADLLLDPPEPNEALQRARAAHARMIGPG